MRNLVVEFSPPGMERETAAAFWRPRHGMSLASLSIAMVQAREELHSEIAKHRDAIARLEARLEDIEGPKPSDPWPPEGFYLTYYVVAGLMLGVLGSLVSFLANVGGSILLGQDPLLFLRVYGTVFLGQEALVTQDLNFFMLVAVVHFSVGAVAGAVFHVFVSLYTPEKALVTVGLGAVYGLLMWVVNFYVVIQWLQTSLYGQSYVLELMPIWVAIASHVLYGVTLGALQPLGRFVPYRPAVPA